MNCQYGYCEREATNTYGLVPLCAEHYVAVQNETIAYYTKKQSTGMDYYGRKHFHEISHLIPWSKAMRERKEINIECEANKYF